MSRSFLRTSVVEGGHPRSGYRIICRVCNADEKIIAANNSNSLPPEAISKKFTQKGWSVGHFDGGDTCPDCLHEKRGARVAPPAPVVKAAVLSPDVAAAGIVAPRDMQREDKRLIFGKIDEVYLDEKRGFEAGWLDQKVASDLGVPLDWVRRVREENFGPEGLNEEARQHIAQIRVLSEALDRMQTANTAQAREILELREKIIRMDRVASDMEKIYGRPK